MRRGQVEVVGRHRALGWLYVYARRELEEIWHASEEGTLQGEYHAWKSRSRYADGSRHRVPRQAGTDHTIELPR